MSGIAVTGWGAVSPAGWGAAALGEACSQLQFCPITTLDSPGLPRPLQVRRVPSPPARPAFAAHPRLRRSSAISLHTAAASLEAIGPRLSVLQSGERQLGIVFTAMTGCVSYSRRFYQEVLTDPTTASPIIFPETVFNAPASHLATYLNTNAINYTLIGDAGSFLQGLAVAAEWLVEERVDACVIVGAEELDWLVATAQELFDARVILGEGAGALLLERADASGDAAIRLDFVTQPALYTGSTTRTSAVAQVEQTIRACGDYRVLFDSLTGAPRVDAPEIAALAAWRGPRVSVKTRCGESFAASSAWQCVLAAEHLARGLHPSAAVCVAGCNQQAIGAGFSLAGTMQLH
jgi:3-oxoacyl-(acyl-carrier-protein) synthase